MKKIDYEMTPEFDEDLKKLSKKYKTLREDLEIVKRAAISLYYISSIDNNSIFPIQGFCTEAVISCKVKKFASKSFKGKGAKSGLRLIYIFVRNDFKVILVEIYYKGVKPNEDKDRLKFYFKQLSV
jgi:mRNA-degrading endonuclease RelE of RelBE toxin-antitoxin system